MQLRLQYKYNVRNCLISILTVHFIWEGASENVHTIDERRSKSLETELSIAICRLTDDKWQSKTLFLAIFDPHALIKSVFDCRLSDVSRKHLASERNAESVV